MRSLALKHALRRLAKAPQFTLVSVAMLALGVALSTAAFGIANGALLRPLPFREPEQLVRVYSAARDYGQLPVAPGNAIELAETLSDIGEFALFMLRNENVAEIGQPPEEMRGIALAANGLRTLGVQPVLGREFRAEESQPSAEPVVLLTHWFWQERYGGDRGVLGKVLRIDAQAHTVIGVLPPEFDDSRLLSGYKYVRALTVWDNWREIRGAKWMNVMGRLKTGVSLEQAQARLNVLAAKLAKDDPVAFGMDRLVIVPLASSGVDDQMRTLHWLIVGLAVLVLVIACANLGGVQLARGFARRGELAVRQAMGARRRDLIAAVAGESVIIAVAGTLLGVVLTFWARSLVQHWLGGLAIALDMRVLGFAAGAGLLAVVGFGLVPAWLATRSSMAEVMKESARGSTGGRAQRWTKHGLIVGQLGLALVLVSSAASVILGVRAFLRRDRGWEPAGLVSAAWRITHAQGEREKTEPTVARAAEEKLRALPGVQGVAIVTGVPIHGFPGAMPVLPEGMPMPDPGREPLVSAMGVTPDFFNVMRIPLRAGRGFDAWRRSDPRVAVVSASTARHFWPNENALGKRLRFGRDGELHEVVGIVGDANFATGFDLLATTMQAYRPIQDAAGPWFNLILRTPLPAAQMERPMRNAIAAIDPDFFVSSFGDTPTILERYASNRSLIAILSAFAATGFVLSMIGLYGVLSQLTEQRRREIGVRMALGATQARIMRMILGHGVRLVGVGLAVGIWGALAATAVLRRAMPALPSLGGSGFVAIGLVLGVAGLAACYLPSRRAARTNPTEALRAE